MILQDWFSLALICFFGALSPGPSLLVILAVTAAQGRRAGLLISFGHGLGVLFYAFLSATGLSLLIVSYENLFVFVQILGAIFLIWLGLNLIRSGLYNAKVNYRSSLNSFLLNHQLLSGFYLAILNPKIVVFCLSLFSQFLAPSQSNLTHLLMAILASLIDVAVYVSVVVLTSTVVVAKLLEEWRKYVELMFGGLLIILSISLFSRVLL